MINLHFLLAMSTADMDREQERLYRMEDKKCYLKNSDRLEKATDVEHYIPWFLDCNRERYPYWFGRYFSNFRGFVNMQFELFLFFKYIPRIITKIRYSVKTKSPILFHTIAYLQFKHLFLVVREKK